MNSTYFTNRIDNCCFWCSSILADYSYIVECLGEDDYDKAIQIAERELGYWSAPESVYSNFSKEEADEKYNYYMNAGYVEVVKNAIDDAKIPVHFYVRELLF